MKGHYEDAFFGANAALRVMTTAEQSHHASLLRQKLLTGFTARLAGRYHDAHRLFSEILGVLDEAEVHNTEPSFELCVLMLAGETSHALLRFDDAATAFDRALELVECHPSIIPEKRAFVFITSARFYASLHQFDLADKCVLLAASRCPQIRLSDSLLAADYHETLGAVHAARGRYALARADFAKSLEIKKVTCGSSHACLIPALLGIGTTSCELLDARRAEACAQEALLILDRESPHFHAATADALRVLACSRMIGGDISSATQLARHALDRSGDFGEYPLQQAFAYDLLGRLERTDGNLDDAVKYAHECSRLLQNHNLGHHVLQVKSLFNVASVHLARRDLGPAMNTYVDGTRLAATTFGNESAYVVIGLIGVGTVFFEADEIANAERAYSHALTAHLATNAGNDELHASLMMNLGNCYLRDGKADDALRQYESAMSIIKEADGEGSRIHAHNLLGLASVHLVNGHTSDAIGLATESRNIADQVCPNEAIAADARIALGTALIRDGRVQEGAGELRDAIDIMRDLGCEDVRMARAQRMVDDASRE